MLRISTVLPFIAVTTSLGREALPSGIFSTAATTPMTGTVGFSSAIARIVPITVAPPDMSYFIASMPSAGLIEMPPVSNVMPLPTSASSSPFLPVFFAGVYRRTISFAGCSEPIGNAQQRTHAELFHFGLVEDLAFEADLFRHLPGRGLPSRSASGYLAARSRGRV